jgi:hypothetical protein
MVEYLAQRAMPDNICCRAPMRNDLLKSVYATMLQEFTFEQVVEFWNNLPMEVAGKPVSQGDLFRHLWTSEKTSTKEYVARVLDCVEWFLVRHGYDVPVFMERLAFRINEGTPVPGKTLITWMKPVLKTIFFATDLRLKVLQLMAYTAEQFIPGSYREVLRVEREGSFTLAWCLFAPDSNLSIRWPYHSELIGLKLMANAPKVLGLPPFEDIRNLSDTGIIEHILWDEKVSVEGNRMFINGEECGESVSFHAYVKRLGFNLDHLKSPDLQVTLMHKPFYCPLRKREVLHKDCAYGAPVWIGMIRYATRIDDQENALHHMIEDMEDTWGEELENRHARLLEMLAEKADFVYLQEANIMLLNGNLLIKGVPAGLLAYMLRAFRDAGKTEFFLSDFKKDTDILTRKLPNLEAFLEKLRDRLATRSMKVSILAGKGRRTLKADCPVHFTEK